MIVEILRWEKDQPPKVLHSFTHTATSLHMVQESMKAVINSSAWPKKANGFCIICEGGTELYRFSKEVN